MLDRSCKHVEAVRTESTRTEDAAALGRRVRLPDAPGGARDRAGHVPDLRHGARAARRRARRSEANPELRRHDAALLGRGRAHRAGVRCWRWPTMLPGSRCSALVPGARAWLQLAPRHAGRAVGRLAVLRARRGARSVTPPPQHVHADRPRHRRRVRLQRRRDARSRSSFPASFRDHGGASPVYFEAAAVITTLVLLGQVLELRARGRTGERHPRAARPRAEDRAPPARRRQRGGRAARRGRGRRPAARAARREGAGRRRRARGRERGRRVDAHRRADPGREGRRRPRDRRHRQRHRRAS